MMCAAAVEAMDWGCSCLWAQSLCCEEAEDLLGHSQALINSQVITAYFQTTELAPIYTASRRAGSAGGPGALCFTPGRGSFLGFLLDFVVTLYSRSMSRNVGTAARAPQSRERGGELGCSSSTRPGVEWEEESQLGPPWGLL